MKAWEREAQRLEAAIPEKREEQDETWSAMAALEEGQDNHVRLQWYSEVPGSGAPECLMEAAVQALENRGMIVPGWQSLADEGLDALQAGDMPRLISTHVRLWNALGAAEKDPDSSYWDYPRYDSWDSFAADCDFDTPGADRTGQEPSRRSPGEVPEPVTLRDRIYAGWLGQIIGGALGTSIEGYTTQRLREAYGDIRGYLVPPSTYNDDLTFELAFLKAYDEFGSGVTAREIGINWAALIPFGWSAEMVALRNLQAGIFPPESGRRNNPFSEWIGAQMRGAICGMVAPGNAREAARLAWLDGSVSHENNGIIGEVFNAVLTARAFVEHDMRTLLAKTIAMLPPAAEYTAVVSYALEQCRRAAGWEEAWAACEARYRRYNWVHAYPNACAEVVALWFGGNDFDETLHIVAMAGQDVDCNAAQIMTALSVAHGPDAIPEHWSAPIGDALNTYVRGMKKLRISELADWTVRAARR